MLKSTYLPMYVVQAAKKINTPCKSAPKSPDPTRRFGSPFPELPTQMMGYFKSNNIIPPPKYVEATSVVLEPAN